MLKWVSMSMLMILFQGCMKANNAKPLLLDSDKIALSSCGNCTLEPFYINGQRVK